uniref:Uncharacterized protein n=1 Tax=Arundo donax TaxID=35708 RepID=A0A0A9H062_ARUDO
MLGPLIILALLCSEPLILVNLNSSMQQASGEYFYSLSRR